MSDRGPFDRIAGCLFGCAVGDALGLPAEGLSRRRIAKWGWAGAWRHHLVFGKGLLSDDTEHTLMVAQAMLASDGDVEVFRRRLARALRWWMLALPAGIGMATAKACLRLWFGISPKRSGVDSAGNGAAMRSAIIGVVFAHDARRRRDFVEAATIATHRDPRAHVGALAVAEIAARLVESEDDLVTPLRDLAGEDDQEWPLLVDRIEQGLREGWKVSEFAQAIGAGDAVSGYVYQTVPVALFAALRHRGDFATALVETLNCGGDTDTVAAIAGALAGTECGYRKIPREWIDPIVDWPRSTRHILRVAEGLEAGRPSGSGQPVPLFWPAIPLRNVLFLGIVLAHGMRRLLPW